MDDGPACSTEHAHYVIVHFPFCACACAHAAVASRPPIKLVATRTDGMCKNQVIVVVALCGLGKYEIMAMMVHAVTCFCCSSGRW